MRRSCPGGLARFPAWRTLLEGTHGHPVSPCAHRKATAIAYSSRHSGCRAARSDHLNHPDRCVDHLRAPVNGRTGALDRPRPACGRIGSMRSAWKARNIQKNCREHGSACKSSLETQRSAVAGMAPGGELYHVLAPQHLGESRVANCPRLQQRTQLPAVDFLRSLIFKWDPARLRFPGTEVQLDGGAAYHRLNEIDEAERFGDVDRPVELIRRLECADQPIDDVAPDGFAAGRGNTFSGKSLSGTLIPRRSASSTPAVQAIRQSIADQDHRASSRLNRRLRAHLPVRRPTALDQAGAWPPGDRPARRPACAGPRSECRTNRAGPASSAHDPPRRAWSRSEPSRRR